jgi:tetratricopeptide (TPR) repeat protein
MDWGARYLGISAAAALMLLSAQPSFALTDEQHCAGKDDTSPDLRITTCTAVIDQPKVKKPQKALALTARGKAYRAKGDNINAIRDFDEAIKINSKDADALFYRGLAFRDRGEADRALLDLELTAKINPKNSVALNTLSHIYYDKRDYDLSIASLNTAIKINPNFALAYFNRGMANRAKGEPDRAIPD